MVLGKLSVPGRPIVGQEPIARAVGVARGCLDFFSRPSVLFSFFLSGTEILSQRAIIPKTTNQLINYFYELSIISIMSRLSCFVFKKYFFLARELLLINGQVTNYQSRRRSRS